MWKILPLNETQYVTCSNDKMLKIWAKGSSKALSSINLGTAVNSLCSCYENDEPHFLVVGTFNGGVALISLKEEKVMQFVDKIHKCYVSSVCTLT